MSEGRGLITDDEAAISLAAGPGHCRFNPNATSPRFSRRRHVTHGTNKGVFGMIDHVVPQQSNSEFLRGLDRTERYVLALFYADQLTISEIGMVLDLTEHRVRGILDRLRDRAKRVLGLAAGVSSA